MKILAILSLLIVFGCIGYTQPGQIKQPPKVPSVPSAVTKVRIHANSNSVYGTSKKVTTPKVDNTKKAQPNKDYAARPDTKTEAELKKTSSKKKKK